MKWLSCRKYFLLLSTLVLISILTTFWSYISVSVHVLSDKNTIEEINYSPEDIDRLQNIPSLLTNSTCYIPDLPLWDEQVELALGSSDHSKDPECWRGGHNWSYVDHFTDELVFNLDVITNNGYDWDGLRCEYRVIKRISETQIELGPETRVASVRTRMTDEFFMVECSGVFGQSLYKMYHAVATLDKADPIQHDRIQRKRERWENVGRKIRRPPNILVISQDSTSRLNLRRFMNKTVNILNSLGAVEMLGYSSVGYGTRTNLIPVLTGYSEAQMWDVCLQENEPYYDTCPLIWRQFDDAGYLTAHLEDSFAGGIHHGDALGFRGLPVDFYNRPLIQKARGQWILSDWEFMNRCIQHETADEFLLNHVDAIVTKADKEGIPFAVFSHSTAMTHDYNGALKFVDGSLSRYLENWISTGIMNNTILILLGDHGIRWGTFREKVIHGSYEVNLPNLWITLPHWMQKEESNEFQALKENRYRLSSHYAVYWTIQHILKKWSSQTYKKPEDARSLKGGSRVARRYTQDFLHSIPELATCHDFGANEFYCPCRKPNSTILVNSDPQVVAAAEVVVAHINRKLIDLELCRVLELDRVKKAMSINLSGVGRKIQMDLVTTPGDGLFDTSVIMSGDNGGEVEIVRINKINKDFTQCTKDRRLELYCYCKS